MYLNRPVIFEHLSALLATPNQYSILLIERAVVALLRLCRLLAKQVISLRHTGKRSVLTSQQATLRDQVYVSFDLLAGLPTNVTNSIAGRRSAMRCW